MKEISYDGPAFDESEQRRKAARSRGSEKVPPLRTFRADVEQMMAEHNVTKAQVVIAETARREARGEARTTKPANDGSHLGRIIFLLLLMLAFGVGIGVYALIGTTTKEPGAALKRPDRQVSGEILLTGSPREQIMADITIAFNKTSLAAGSMREIAFIEKDADGRSLEASTAHVLTAVSLLTPPETLLRALHEEYIYGIYAGQRSLAGYFQIGSRSYPDAFSSILEWEKSMPDDLVPVLNPTYGRTAIASVRNRTFVDERIQGVDVRVLRDESGTLVLGYAFIDNRETLIIVGGEEAFRALLQTTP